MVLCFVYGCNHRSDRNRNNECHFVRFPQDTKMCKKWINVIRRGDKNPGKYSRICTCHFEADNALIPSIFPWNVNKKLDFKSPEKKIRKKNERSFSHDAGIDNINMEGSTACSARYTESDLLVTDINSRIDCSTNTDIACLAPDNESDLPMTERRDEITYLKINVEKLQNENKDLRAKIEEYASMQDEFENLKQENENLWAKIHEYVCEQDEFEKLKNQNENREYSLMRDELESLRLKLRSVEEEKLLPVEEENKKNKDTMQQDFATSVFQKEDLVQHYTGISSKSFHVIEKLVADVECDKHVIKPSEKHQLLLTLMKLRHSSTNRDLALRFGISTGTVSNIIHIYIKKLHSVIFMCLMDVVPSRFKNSLSLPKGFETFSNCRMIIDCTEVPCDIPGSMDQQKMTYSSYKSKNTFKVLIGCAPNGACTFCSDLYPGSTSDRAIVQHCGILKIFEAGDLVLADKGFTISDILPEGVSLNIPPFLNTPQFSVDEIYETTRTAQARIHIERVINRVKKFRITRHIPASLFGIANEIMQVCVALVNFQSAIIKSVAPSMSLTSSIKNPSTADTDDAEDLIQYLSI